MASIPATLSERDAHRGEDRHDAESILVAASRGGDHAAFARLTGPYQAPLLRYLIRQTGDAIAAEDLVQETLLDAYRGLDTLRRDASFPAWLYRIAHNRLRMERRKMRLRQFVSLDWLVDRSVPMPAAVHQEDDSPACHERDLIDRVLANLSPISREILLPHDLAGFDSGEIAAILGTSISAAQKRLSRAKSDFRRIYLTANGR